MLDASAPPEELLAEWLRPQARGIASINDDISIGTRTGAERKSNQDRALVARFGDVRSGPVDVFVTCDGMGGMVEGGSCAEQGIAGFLLALARLMLGGLHVTSALQESVQEANRRIFARYNAEGGTTLAAIVSHRGSVTAACVGDTRLMLVRNDGSSVQLSRDDTMGGALDALGHVRVERTPEHDRLVQFVGMGRDLQPHVFPVADLHACRFLVLTTDGAYRLGGELVPSVSRHAVSPKQIVDRVLRMAEWLGGSDDATLIAVTGHSLRSAATTEPDGLLRIWGPSHQQLVLWLPQCEGPRALERREARAPAQVAASRPPRPDPRSRNKKKPPRSRKGRGQAPLPLPETPELIIDLGGETPANPPGGDRNSPAPPQSTVPMPDGVLHGPRNRERDGS